MINHKQRKTLSRTDVAAETDNQHGNLLASILPDQWTISYVALLFYTFSIVTQRFPLGTVSIVIGLIALVLTKQSLRIAPPVIWLALFLAWSSIFYFASDYQPIVADSLNTLLKLVLITFLTVNAIRTRKQAIFFLIFASAWFLYYPIRVTLFNYFVFGYTSAGRAIGSGIYSNPNDLAALTLLQVSVLLAISVGLKQRWARWGTIFLALVMATVIALTQSRGVLLGAIAMLAVVVGSTKRKSGIILSLFIAIGVITIVVPSSTFDRFEKLVSTVGGEASIADADEEGSARERREIYRIAIRISADHPVYGVGLGAYPYANADYNQRAFDGVIRGSGIKDAHSTYLTILAETGLPGLLFMTLMFTSTLKSARKIRRHLNAVDPQSAKQIGLLVSGYIGFLVAAIVGTYTNLAIIYVHLCAIWALCESYRPFDFQNNNRRESVGRSD